MGKQRNRADGRNRMGAGWRGRNGKWSRVANLGRLCLWGAGAGARGSRGELSIWLLGRVAGVGWTKIIGRRKRECANKFWIVMNRDPLSFIYIPLHWPLGSK